MKTTTENNPLRPNYRTKWHRDGMVTYWSVYLQQWQRVSAYELTCRHDEYASLPASDQERVSRMALAPRGES